MHGPTLYWGLRRGRRAQKRLAEIAYTDMGEIHQHDYQNRGEIPSIELLCSGTFNPIRVDIYTTHQLGHGRHVHGSG